MSLLAPGSVAWLLRHELRLRVRMSAKAAWRLIAVLSIMLVAVATFAGGPLASLLAHRRLSLTPMLSVSVALGAMVLFTLMLSQVLSMTVQAFYERGDLDLLLSSPLPPRRVLLVRCGAITVSAAGIYLLLATPFLMPIALWGHPRVLAGYLVLIALGLSATAAGLGLAAALFSTLGARRTKTVGQVLAAIIGALIVLASQVPQFLPHHHAVFAHWLRGALLRGWFAPGALLSWPAAAVLGAPEPLLVLLGSAVMLFLAAVHLAGERFAAQVGTAAGVNFRSRRSRPLRRLRTGISGALIRKELRLILRDPALLSRVLLQVIYLIPITFVTVRGAAGAHAHIAMMVGVALLALVGGQIAGSLAWITISAEDAPDLLRCAPVAPALVRRAKLIAALIPSAVLAAAALALSWFDPWAGLAGMLGIGASSLSNVLIQHWFEKPATRKSFRRRSNGSVLASLGAILVSMGWAGVTAIAAYGEVEALAVAVVAAIVPAGLLGLLWLSRRRDAQPAYQRALP